jgi:hypothetical protein
MLVPKVNETVHRVMFLFVLCTQCIQHLVVDGLAEEAQVGGESVDCVEEAHVAPCYVFTPLLGEVREDLEAQFCWEGEEARAGGRWVEDTVRVCECRAVVVGMLYLEFGGRR